MMSQMIMIFALINDVTDARAPRWDKYSRGLLYLSICLVESKPVCNAQQNKDWEDDPDDEDHIDHKTTHMIETVT